SQAQAAGLGRQAHGITLASQASTSGKPAKSATITGQVVNSTLNNAPVANQPVILQFSQGAKIKDLKTVKTDAQGHFTFTGVTPTANANQDYAVYTHFQNGLYSSDPIQVKAGATQQATVTVYNATQDASNLSISVVTILFRDIDQQHQLHGLISFGEFVTIQNKGKTAFVGSFTPGKNGMPPLLRFTLPANATNVTTGIGFFNSQVIQVNGGFATSATVPPGSTEFAFSFDAPYSGTTFTLPFTAEYPTAQVVALVPPDMFVRDSPGFQAQGLVVAFSSNYQTFTANNLAANQQASIHLWNLPKAGEQADLDTTQLTWLALGLALLIAILLAFYLRQGNLAVTLGLVPARALKAARQAEANARKLDRGQREAERKRLLKRLLSLEKAHESGALTDREYHQKQTETRATLKALLAADLPVSLPTPVRASKPERTAQAGLPADEASGAGGEDASQAIAPDTAFVSDMAGLRRMTAVAGTGISKATKASISGRAPGETGRSARSTGVSKSISGGLR
ncbi:MAG TPA: hypothetical protein VKQ36_02310, partial [Ktedonobacterales bacterium]|nr:hypothetical protein [Ktedonobacterales bacterium]